MDEAQAEKRDGFTFRGGAAALDFIATLTKRLTAEPRDLLTTPRDLGRWLRAANVAQIAPHVSEEELLEARRLREAIFALARARADSAPPPAGARSTLNRFAAQPAASVQLNAHGGVRVSGTTQQFLAKLAQDAVQVLADPHALRQCEGETCAIFFIDRSRAGDRRWCSMSACGNRAKVAEFRRRKGQ